MKGLFLICSVMLLVSVSVLTPQESVIKSLSFPPTEGTYLVVVDQAVDGDTVDFYWLVKGRARLAGINAPEIKTIEGKKAKEHLTTISAVFGKQVSLFEATIEGKDKYGRTLLRLQWGGRDLSRGMIKAGHAKEWNGKGKRP